MSVCPGCGRCRECGQRPAPAPVVGPYIYPWGTWPYQPGYQTPYVGDPMPWQQGTITVTSGVNT